MKKILSYMLTLVFAMSTMVMETSCTNGQSEAVALLNAAGPAVANVVAAISPANAALAAKIKTDFAAASDAVSGFKAGKPCADVIQVLNIVVSDLNLVPQVGPYAALIAIAVAGVEAVLAVFPACQLSMGVHVDPKAKMGKPAMSAAQYKSLWNKEVSKHPELKGATIK